MVPMSFFAVAGVVFVVAILFIVLSDSWRGDMLRCFAEKHRCRYVDGVLRVPIQGRQACVQFQYGMSRSTTLRLPLSSFQGGTIEIVEDPLPYFGPIHRSMLAIGDERFDRAFDVRSSPVSLAVSLFAPSRRAAVIATIRRFEGQALSIKAGNGWLDVRVGGLLEEAGLLLLMRTAEEMVVHLAGDDGIRWVESQTLTGTCPVCSSALAEPLVRCSRCDTPHHEECWRYLERCAVYGCDPQKRRRAA